MDRLNKVIKSSGVILPMIAIGLLGIMGAVGLAIDMGHGYLNKTRLQSALDAAALSGARTLMRTQDAATATQHAKDAFNEHLEGEMSDLTAANVGTEYSVTLNPFVNNTDPGVEKYYIRVSFQGFQTAFSFSALLPGLGSEFGIGSTAVAGGVPLGGPGSKTCDIAPLLMCGSKEIDGTVDRDCTDVLGECYGVTVKGKNEFQLKTGSDTEGDQAECSQDGYYVDKHGNTVFHEFDHCEPSPEGGVGPGNFQALAISGNGANTFRENLAGSYDSCLTLDAQSPTLTTEPGNMVGPARDGLNTRFGIYGNGQGGLQASEYYKDLVLTERKDVALKDYWYEDYKAATEAALSNPNFTMPTYTAAYRRVIAVPIVDCTGAEAGKVNDLQPMGLGCFFLTRSIKEPGGGSGGSGGAGKDSYIYGQFIGGCEVSGSISEYPPSTGSGISGTWKIILFKDPNTVAS